MNLKRVLFLMPVLAVVLSLCACGKSVKKESETMTTESVAGTKEEIYLTLVNKTHELPDQWEEKIELVTASNSYGKNMQVEKNTYEAFTKLKEALEEEGVDIELDSCYRSVERQEELWDEFEKEYGLDYCKQYVAVPGYSEHHTGMAVDVCLVKDGKLIDENEDMMKETEIWEKVHAKLADYGFILRYQEGKEDITGYSYEPWHLRYVGSPETAREIADQDITLEEYSGQ